MNRTSLESQRSALIGRIQAKRAAHQSTARDIARLQDVTHALLMQDVRAKRRAPKRARRHPRPERSGHNAEMTP